MNLAGAWDHPWIAVWASIATLVAAAGCLSYGPLGTLRARTALPLPETRWTYTAESLRAFLASADPSTVDVAAGSPAGWSLYRSALLWDFLFALVYGTAGTLAVDGTFGRAIGATERGLRWLVLAPFVLAIVDGLEDGVLLDAVRRSESEADLVPRGNLIPLANLLTRIKLVLAVVSIAAFLGGAGAMVFAPPIA